jgi:GntR family transcriptional regulator/MocR family aminotransferase
MGKSETFQDLSLMPPAAGQELGRWLYTELRAAILDGRLKPGSRMPSTRGLSKQYSVARGTVAAAFDSLKSEGYIEASVGAGTFVSIRIPDQSMSTPPDSTSGIAEPSHAGLAQRGRDAVRGVHLLPASHSIAKAFRSYEPAIDLFPVNLWSRVAGRVLRRAPRSLYGQGDARGYLPLRKAIAEYVGAARGVRCDAGRIIITSGTQQALDIIARMLLDPGDAVWMEDPGYPGAVFSLRAAGVQVVPIPVDQDGLMVAEGRKAQQHARMAYVTPSNQFPLGVAMAQHRRLELLDWAAQEDAWIVEDEYDAEYRYFGRPLTSLQSMDRSGCVIYVGTFTKMLFNSLRSGFLVLPERIVDAFAAARTVLDRHPPTLDQAILTEFILDGHFGHHVRRMRQVYARRMAVLSEAARDKLGGQLDVAEVDSGMRMLGWIRTGEKDADLANRARSRGLEVTAMSDFRIQHPRPDALILGFAGCPATELKRGVGVLAGVLDGYRVRGRAQSQELKAGAAGTVAASADIA